MAFKKITEKVEVVKYVTLIKFKKQRVAIWRNA